MGALALLLLPAAGLPPPPARLERRHLAGYEFEAGGAARGTFRFHEDGRWENLVPTLVTEQGSWQVHGGVLYVTEAYDGRCFATYEYRLRRSWRPYGELSGRATVTLPHFLPKKCSAPLTLRNPRRFK